PAGIGLQRCRSVAIAGRARVELGFSRLYSGEVPSVAMAGDIRANDGKESLCTGDPLAFADAAEGVPHDAWDAEPGLVGVTGLCGVRHGALPSVIAVPT